MNVILDGIVTFSTLLFLTGGNVECLNDDSYLGVFHLHNYTATHSTRETHQTHQEPRGSGVERLEISCLGVCCVITGNFNSD